MIAPSLVTITGADDAVDPAALAALSAEFPFVEWGVLLSATRAAADDGQARYPSHTWVLRLAGHRVRLSVHVCGRLMEATIAGVGFKEHRQLLGHASRVQLNGYRPSLGVALADARSRFRHWETILQARSAEDLGPTCDDTRKLLHGSVLWDASGGRGIAPERWPSCAGSGPSFGFAGGITPDNVEATIAALHAASDGAPRPYWIDMETGVRTDDRFDLAKVRAVLETVGRMRKEGGT